MKKLSRTLCILIAVLMISAVIPLTSVSTSAASFTIWWKTDSCTNPANDFSIEYNPSFIDTSSWYWLYKLNEESGRYELAFDERGVSICGYIGSGLNIYYYVLLNGSGTYKVVVKTSSGTEYETTPKKFTLNGSLEKPTNLRWDGKIARWDAVEGANGYALSLFSNKNGSYELWSETWSAEPYYDFSDSMSNECDYKFRVQPRSSDPLKQAPISEDSPVLTVKYERKKITAHMGKVSDNEKKHTLYWEPYPQATGYYIFVGKKNGREFEYISNVCGDVGNVIRFDLYDAFVKNGAGEYQIAIYAYNGKVSNQISEGTVVSFTYTPCEHAYVRKIPQKEYLASTAANCTETTNYYYACLMCCEMAPKEAKYIYEGLPGQHILEEKFSVDDKYHWRECTECGHKDGIEEHTRDANNYCAGCNRTLFDVWVGGVYLTSQTLAEEKLGSYYYDPYTNTLNISSLLIDSRCGYMLDEDDEWRAMIYAKGDLTLNIMEEASLTEEFDQFAVVVENGDLTVIGGGDLYAEASGIFWVKNGDIHINSNGTLNLNGTHSVFKCDNGSIYMENGTVTAQSVASKIFSSKPIFDDYGAYFGQISTNIDGSDPKEYEYDEDMKYFHIEPAYMVQIRPYEVEGETILITVKKGDTYTLPECPYSAPSGKKFLAWGITPLGIGRDPGETLTVNQNIELLPLWMPLASYTVSFDANGGSGAMEDSKATENEPYTIPECTITAPDGMRFVSWAIGSPDGERKAVGESVVLTEATTLYAVWESIPHEHDFGTVWKTDENNHWKECSCEEKSALAAHTDGNGDNKCDTCDYAMPAHDPDTPDQPDNPDNPGTNPPADNPPSVDEGGLGAGAIIGIVVGSVAVVGIGGFALFWFVIKKKSFADLIAVFKK